MSAPGTTAVTGTMSDDGGEITEPRSGAGLVLVYAAPLGSAPRAFALASRAAVIGRDPPAGGWAIRQHAVSRLHASFELGPGDAVTLRDLGSRNGSFVNGQAVKSARLAHGDVVRIGDAVFVFSESDAAAHLAFPLEGTARAGLAGGLAMGRVAEAIDAVGPGDATVLVSGETGVGKELVARALHAASGRRGRLAAINCAAIPANLVESELFGFERGAFTGATRAHEGIVRSARGGTLLLDEIGDMPLEVQAKLLRLLESREVLPLGAARAVTVDVRVVCATHQDLPALVRAGRFRADLYARIAQRVLFVPPLRARKEDLYALVRHALEGRGGAWAAPSFGFMLRLALHDWPFNVRELVSAVHHAADLARGGELRAPHLPASVGAAVAAPEPASAPSGPAPRRKAPTVEALRELLATSKGNVAAVARALSCDPAQVYRWIRQYELRPDEFRER
jgi:sigma-54 dependent transcriptional regulator, acetoin dehydrogenase operon transcriptional activator AcoR